MYHGLVKLVLVDPSSGGAVFDFLLPHFLHFFKEVYCMLVFFVLLFSIPSLIHYWVESMIWMPNVMERNINNATYASST